KFLLKTILVFCASGLSLWGIPSGANDDDELLLRQLSSLQDELETTIETIRTALENFGEIAKTKAQELSQAIRDEGKWASYVNEFARMQAVCFGYGVRMIFLKDLAFTCKDAALHGLYPTYLPDGDVTDPIMEAWAAFSITLHSPSGMD
ncbi:MAG: hypothetical protein LBD40_02680, partial [Puniceicoccales bacterium]|nr:hypothetical protein [Puniceicoccales bacterium]